MTQFLSMEKLAEIESRCDRATAGPWKSWIVGRDHSSGDSFIATGGNDIYLSGATREDQDFIASARQDVPLLIHEIRRLRAQLEPEAKGSGNASDILLVPGPPPPHPELVEGRTPELQRTAQ